MTELQRRLSAVRRAWKQTQASAGLLMLGADVIVVILAMIVIDTIYKPAQPFRVTMFFAALVVLAGAVLWVLVKPLRRQATDDEVALSVENRFPELQGTLITAVEYARKPRGEQIEQELVDALMVDCLHRAARVDLARAIDRRRIMIRGLAAAFLLVFLLGAVAVERDFFKREVVRVLLPWWNVPANTQTPMSDEEIAREKLAAIDPLLPVSKAIGIEVKPGNFQVMRRGMVPITAELTTKETITSVTLVWTDSEGKQHDVPMTESKAVPNQFETTLRNITENTPYYVFVDKDNKSPRYEISVYDPGEVRSVTVTLKYPDQYKLPPKELVGGDATNIEALPDTVAKFTIVSSTPMKEGRIKLLNAADAQQPKMVAKGNEISGELTIQDSGVVAVEATDVNGVALKLDKFIIKALKDEPPTMEVLYPMIDNFCHPLEELAYGCKVADDWGIKEVRLVYYYNMGEPKVITLSGLKNNVPQKEMLADFVLPLEDQPMVSVGDMVLYHFEVVDTSGRTESSSGKLLAISSDIYKTTVRPFEAWAVYGGPGHMGATHGYGGADLVNIAAATWALQAEREALLRAKQFEKKQNEFNKQCEDVAEKMMRVQKKAAP